MSANPSIIFYQGLRCTKVPRKPRATDPPRPSTTSSSSGSGTVADEPTFHQASSSDRSTAQSTSREDTPTTTTTAPARTTSNLTSDTEPSSSSQATSPDREADPSDLYTSTTSDELVTRTTFITETTTTIQTTTPNSRPIVSTTDDDSEDPPYATIFGSLFGSLFLIALIAIILFLFFRRRRSRRDPTAANCWNVRTIFRGDRASTGSRTSLHRDFKPETSYFSDASPASSTLFKPGIKPYFDNPHHETKNQTRYSDPFSDLAEVPNTQDPKSSIVPFIMRGSVINPGADDEHPARPAETHIPDRDSVQSGTSLGSTLVLPGRGSIGSDYQETTYSFPKPPATGHSYPRAVVRMENARSDPFDLGLDDISSNKQISASRRSSGTIPVVL
ncbi:hypothetical protein BJY04DRAFT_202353, partial [Aspergillus karnatakaensis]|uniref:uncharacterized protein n=1 Tax=Aspergillus karnatakaensis TaxID=1810916 RepID=UPI003CCD93BF